MMMHLIVSEKKYLNGVKFQLDDDSDNAHDHEKSPLLSGFHHDEECDHVPDTYTEDKGVHASWSLLSYLPFSLV